MKRHGNNQPVGQSTDQVGALLCRLHAIQFACLPARLFRILSLRYLRHMQRFTESDLAFYYQLLKWHGKWRI